MVLLVGLEMLGQVFDSLGQKSDLNLGEPVSLAFAPNSATIFCLSSLVNIKINTP